MQVWLKLNSRRNYDGWEVWRRPSGCCIDSRVDAREKSLETNLEAADKGSAPRHGLHSHSSEWGCSLRAFDFPYLYLAAVAEMWTSARDCFRVLQVVRVDGEEAANFIAGRRRCIFR